MDSFQPKPHDDEVEYFEVWSLYDVFFGSSQHFSASPSAHGHIEDASWFV